MIEKTFEIPHQLKMDWISKPKCDIGKKVYNFFSMKIHLKTNFYHRSSIHHRHRIKNGFRL